ncbi:ferric reductase-like transmembrane domain-containing protein [Candidatus Curtissbacteria bacterium]|nr:ferric reductase-like transmembrane domain-containing protein [Candidatus Curtissbacteria bacterium]
MLGSLFRNSRFYVLFATVAYSILVFLWVVGTSGWGVQAITKLVRLDALSSLFLLYIALLIGPMVHVFAALPYKGKLIHARRAIGVSAFYFGLLHGTTAFFGELGGFAGLFYLDIRYLIAISLSFTALLILSAMAATSFDFMIRKLTFARWKALHRLVYVAGTLIVIHALMLGSDFQDLYSPIAQTAFVLLAFLLILEGLATDKYMALKHVTYPRIGVASLIVFSLISAALVYLFAPISSTSSLGIHSAHIALAKQAQQGNVPGASQSVNTNIPGLNGDRTKRFTVSFIHPDNVNPNEDVPLGFQIFDASSGNPVVLFSTIYEKPMHFIIVSSSLDYFDHIHPVQDGSTFKITTKFPAPGQYHLYVDFQPLGAIEQQFAFTLNVGNVDQAAKASQQPDADLKKNFGDYVVSLDTGGTPKASVMSLGGQKFTFKVTDKNGNDVTNLKPYLAAFGHMVMIKEDTYDYLHVHPNNLVAPKPDATGGPIVEFLPIGIYGPIKSGIYRVFTQFNPGGKLILTDFTVKVEQ